MPMQRLKRACPSDCSSIMGDSPTSLNAVSRTQVSRHRYRDGAVRDGRPIPDAARCHVRDDGPHRRRDTYTHTHSSARTRPAVLDKPLEEPDR